MSDLWMLINSFHIEIECKTGSSQLSKSQKNWRDMILKTGHYFIEARNIPETILQIENIIKGRESERNNKCN